jgi:Holliday junction resolvase-like predicted endonuclease
MLEIEIFQPSSELDMVIHQSASRWLKNKDSNTLVCNIEANAGEVTLMASTERDQTVSVT